MQVDCNFLRSICVTSMVLMFCSAGQKHSSKLHLDNNNYAVCSYTLVARQDVIYLQWDEMLLVIYKQFQGHVCLSFQPPTCSSGDFYCFCVNTINWLKLLTAERQKKNCYPVSMGTTCISLPVFVDSSKKNAKKKKMQFISTLLYFSAQIGKNQLKQAFMHGQMLVLINSIFTEMLLLSLIEARLHKSSRHCSGAV